MAEADPSGGQRLICITVEQCATSGLMHREEMPERSTLGAMSNPEHDLVDAPAAHRPMSWVALIGVLLAFMLLPAIVDVVVLKHSSTGDYPDQDSVNVLLIGQSIALAIVVLTISLARWWPVVLHERLRVRPWVWIVAALPVVTALAMTDYGRLGDSRGDAEPDPPARVPADRRQ